MNMKYDHALRYLAPEVGGGGGEGDFEIHKARVSWWKILSIVKNCTHRIWFPCVPRQIEFLSCQARTPQYSM